MAIIFAVIFGIFSFSPARAAESALSFDGIDDYVLFPNFDLGGTYSIEGKFKTVNADNWRTLFKDDYQSFEFGSIYVNYNPVTGFNELSW